MSFEEVFHLSLEQLSLIIGGRALGHAAGCSDAVVPLPCCCRSRFLPQTEVWAPGLLVPPACSERCFHCRHTGRCQQLGHRPSRRGGWCPASFPGKPLAPDLIVWLYFPTPQTLPEVVRGFGPPGSQLLLAQPSLPAPWAHSSLAASRGQALWALWGGKHCTSPSGALTRFPSASPSVRAALCISNPWHHLILR